MISSIFRNLIFLYYLSGFVIIILCCSYVLRYGGTWIRVDRTREQQTLDLHMGIPWETVTLTSFGRNKELYFNILEEGIKKIILIPSI